MAVHDLVLIDTCIWVPFFNRPQSREKLAVDELLDDDRAALIGPVLTEILLGFRRDEQADWVASELRGLQYLHVTWNEWRAAAKLGRSLIATGRHLPQTDLTLKLLLPGQVLVYDYSFFTDTASAGAAAGGGYRQFDGYANRCEQLHDLGHW